MNCRYEYHWRVYIRDGDFPVTLKTDTRDISRSEWLRGRGINTGIEINIRWYDITMYELIEKRKVQE